MTSVRPLIAAALAFSALAAAACASRQPAREVAARFARDERRASEGDRSSSGSEKGGRPRGG